MVGGGDTKGGERGGRGGLSRAKPCRKALASIWAEEGLFLRKASACQSSVELYLEVHGTSEPVITVRISHL